MTHLSHFKVDKIKACREEAIVLVNQGYLAKAIVHLEKELGAQTPFEKNVTLELIKKMAFDGGIKTKNEVIHLINLI